MYSSDNYITVVMTTATVIDHVEDSDISDGIDFNFEHSLFDLVVIVYACCHGDVVICC